MDVQNLTDELNKVETPEQALRWLNIVLYTLCDFIPVINEDNAYNMALGHPYSMWLYEHNQTIEKWCKSIPKNGENIPLALIRLPPLIIRFRKFLLPHIEEFNDKTVLQIKELWPNYFP